MLMSAAGCVEAGLTFASVHDSYWTHARDVEVMNEVLRRQFIVLHSNNIMMNLEKEFMERYKDYLYPVSLTIANPGEPVGEGMIAWNDERIRRKNAKISGAESMESDRFLSDSEVFDSEGESSALELSKARQSNVFHFGDDEDDEHDLSSVVIEEDEEELEAEARAMDKALRKGTKSKKAANKMFHSWEAISFPPLPDRGDFDVRKVAESDYFFS